MNKKTAEMRKITIEKQMSYMGVPVLHYRIEYPQFDDPHHRQELESINRYYRNQAMGLQEKYETVNYEDAVESFQYSEENQFPFHMFEAVSAFTVPYRQNDLLSLFYDHYTYSGGAHGNTVRVSDTWNLKEGCRKSLYQLSGDPEGTRKIILDRINEQIALQIKAGEGMYFDDYIKLTDENFHPENYYLTPEGLVIYYQQYDIAPYASGIPEFTLPLQWRKP
jgi:hypothetical protein